MFSFDEGVKYIALIAVIYFLVRAFVQNKLTSKDTNLLVIFIAIPIIVICMILPKNKKKIKMEPFQITDPPITSSIYPGPPNNDVVLGTVQVPPNDNLSGYDTELLNYATTGLGMNRKQYDGLVAEENRAKDKIRQSWTNEMVFTETNPLNTIPLGSQLYGYTYLPMENWMRAYERPPVCLTNNPVVVNPIGEGVRYSDLLEFDAISNAVPKSIGLTSPNQIKANIGYKL